jgi:hypothetical protein
MRLLPGARRRTDAPMGFACMGGPDVDGHKSSFDELRLPRRASSEKHWTR